MAKRKRDVPVLFYVSKDEMELISAEDAGRLAPQT